jgi:hypothetical protein
MPKLWGEAAFKKTILREQWNPTFLHSLYLLCLFLLVYEYECTDWCTYFLQQRCQFTQEIHAENKGLGMPMLCRLGENSNNAQCSSYYLGTSAKIQGRVWMTLVTLL